MLYDDDGRVLTRNGEPVPRPPNTVPPCHRCAKVPADAPKKSWEHAADWTSEMRQVWEFYRECKAVGAFPDDPLVRRFAAAAAEAEEQAGRVARRRETAELVSRIAAAVRR